MSKRYIAIDSQKLDAIQNCLYYYKLRYEDSWVPMATPDYLDRGGLLHHMLAVYYNMRRHRGRWITNRKTHADVVQSCVIAGRHAGNRMQLDISDIERTIEVFQDNVCHWENDGWDNIVGVEQVGSKVLYDSEELCILYEVKIDLVLQLANAIVPVDHKSSQSRRDPNQCSNQFKGYCWFLGSNNIIINEIGFQKTVKPKDKYLRHTVSYSDSLIREWVANSTYWIQDAVDKWDHEEYPRNFTSCDKFSGCCFKSEICTRDYELRDYKLKTLFKQMTWDPGKEHL